jgi:ATP-dependent DNA ligase
MTTALPKITTLVLKRRAQAFDNPDWLFDLKYDGFRALLEIDGSGARLVSRNRNRFKHMDTLAAGLAKRLRVSDAILDGEIICADETGRPIFLEMLRGRHPAHLAEWGGSAPIAAHRAQGTAEATPAAPFQSPYFRSHVGRWSWKGADGRRRGARP